MKGISIPPQTGIAIAQHRNRWSDGVKLHKNSRTLNVTHAQNHVTRLQGIVGLLAQMAMNIRNHANKHIQLLRFDENESTRPGRDEEKAGQETTRPRCSYQRIRPRRRQDRNCRTASWIAVAAGRTAVTNLQDKVRGVGQRGKRKTKQASEAPPFTGPQDSGSPSDAHP